MVLGVSAAITLATTFYCLGQKKIYRANSTLEIDPNAIQPLGKDIDSVELGVSSYWNNKEYYQTQYKIIQSRKIAGATVRALGLQHDGGFLENLPPNSPPATRDVPVATAADILIARTTVEPLKDSRLVVISYEDADPARAQKVLSALVNTYVQSNIDNALTSSNSTADWLNGQLGKLKDELKASEMALYNYKKDNNILSVSIDDQSNMLRTEMMDLGESLTKVRVQEQQAAARKAELDKVDPHDPSRLPATELLNDVLLQSMREDYVSAEATRNGLLGAGLGPNHPQVVAATAKVDTTRAALVGEVKNIQASATRDLSALRREASGLDRLFKQAKSQALDLNLLGIQYNRLLRNKTNTEKLYSLVLERTKQNDLTRMMRFNNISVVDSALVPHAPVRPRVPLDIALGAVFGLALGVGTALGRQFLDRSIKTPDEVERDIGLTFVGLLPLLDDRQATYGRRSRSSRRRARAQEGSGEPELVVHNHPTSGVAEAARAVRTNIMFMSPDSPPRCILVTSAAPSEGKTTVACCVAIAMAQAGQRVLLVDCDLRRPRLHRIFRQDSAVGVTSAVIDPALLDDRDLGTEIPNLSVLPCGPQVPNPAELLHSESFARLLRLLAGRYDRLVLDSPPVVPVTDAAVLSTQVDTTLLVVRAFKTSRDLARQAARSLQDVGGAVPGVVLNAVDLNRREYGYYHYYYYKGDGYVSEASGRDAQAEADG